MQSLVIWSIWSWTLLGITSKWVRSAVQTMWIVIMYLKLQVYRTVQFNYWVMTAFFAKTTKWPRELAISLTKISWFLRKDGKQSESNYIKSIFKLFQHKLTYFNRPDILICKEQSMQIERYKGCLHSKGKWQFRKNSLERLFSVVCFQTNDKITTK